MMIKSSFCCLLLQACWSILSIRFNYLLVVFISKTLCPLCNMDQSLSVVCGRSCAMHGVHILLLWNWFNE
jgi:hypothetical protein